MGREQPDVLPGVEIAGYLSAEVGLAAGALRWLRCIDATRFQFDASWAAGGRAWRTLWFTERPAEGGSSGLRKAQSYKINQTVVRLLRVGGIRHASSAVSTWTAGIIVLVKFCKNGNAVTLSVLCWYLIVLCC